MSFLDLRDEYVSRWGAWPSVRRAKPHDQDFTDAEFARISTSGTPIVLVTPMGIVGDEDMRYTPGDLNADFRWAAIVIARQGDATRAGSKSNGDVAAAIAGRIVRDLSRGDTFAESTGRATDIEAGNTSTSANAAKGVAVWAVAWTQSSTIADDVTITLVDLETIYTEFDTQGDAAPEAVSEVAA